MRTKNDVKMCVLQKIEKRLFGQKGCFYEGSEFLLLGLALCELKFMIVRNATGNLFEDEEKRAFSLVHQILLMRVFLGVYAILVAHEEAFRR